MDLTPFSLENLSLLPLWFPAVVIGMFAGLLGSFINVCIYRIPQGLSIVLPRSRCCSCSHVLGVPDLVPILSWLALRGRCRHCGADVSPRYALVEGLVVCIWVGSFLALGMTSAFLGLAAALSLLVTLTGIWLYGRSLPPQGARSGLTFIEILFTAVILAGVVGPFINGAVQARSGAVRNRERILAYALAREKLEELRCLPVRKLASDWDLYRGKSSASSEDIYRDEVMDIWAEMDNEPGIFWSKFSDVATELGETTVGRMPERVFPKFKKAFADYYGFPYEPYPADYGNRFRRWTKVDDLTDKAFPGNQIKRVTVSVEINSAIHHAFVVTLSSYYSDN